MQSETGFPSSHQLKSYVASKSRLKLAARAVLSADAGLLVCIRWTQRSFDPLFCSMFMFMFMFQLINILCFGYGGDGWCYSKTGPFAVIGRLADTLIEALVSLLIGQFAD